MIHITTDQIITSVLHNHLPTASDFHTVSGNEPFSAQDYTLHVENQLATPYENTQLETAFDYLFRITVAHQTKQPFNVNRVDAMQGHKRIKDKFPKSYFFDVHFMAAKTQLETHMHRSSMTMNYHRSATKIYGYCFLFAQLDLVHQTKVLPETLDKNWLFLPKGTFMDEFEQLEALAKANFISQLTPKDSVTHTTEYNGRLDAPIIINDTLVVVNLADNPGYNQEEVAQLVSAYFLTRIKNDSGAVPYFTKIALYKARFGEMETINLDEFYGDNLDRITEDLYELIK